MNKIKRTIIMGMLCMTTCMVFFGCGSKEKAYYTDEEIFKETEADTQVADVDVKASVSDNDPPICVYICGEVNSPGVYELPAGSRIFDVVEKAGGFTEEASTDYWNQAQVLEDGEMISVPTKEEAKERIEEGMRAYGDVESDDTSDGRININTASKELLMTINGIGAGRADNIIQYRSEHGKFDAIEDIKNVSGIGDSIFENIKDYITVN